MGPEEGSSRPVEEDSRVDEGFNEHAIGKLLNDRRPSPAEQAIVAQSAATVRLEKAVSILSSRLVPILAKEREERVFEPGEDDRKSVVGHGTSDMVSNVISNTTRIDESTQRINRLISNLEI